MGKGKKNGKSGGGVVLREAREDFISSLGSSGTCSPFDVREEKGERGRRFFVVMPSGSTVILSYLISLLYPLPRFSPRVLQACHAGVGGPKSTTGYGVFCT